MTDPSSEPASTRVNQEVETTSAEEQVLQFRLLKGRYEVQADRLNEWIHGYQTVIVHVCRKEFDLEDKLELDTGRGNHGVFLILDDWENVRITVTHHYHGLGKGEAKGKVHLACRFLDDSTQPPSEPFSILSPFMRKLNGTLRAEATRDAELECQKTLEASSCDVQIYGAGIFNGRFSHWLAEFTFTNGIRYTCELTAIDDAGNRFSTIRYNLKRRTCDSGLFPCKGCTALTHPQICIQTSEYELCRKCRIHPMNGQFYHLSHNNCQLWLKLLLVNGYKVPLSSLPDRGGRLSARMAEAAGAASAFLAAGGTMGLLEAAANGMLGQSVAVVGAAVATARVFKWAAGDVERT